MKFNILFISVIFSMAQVFAADIYVNPEDETPLQEGSTTYATIEEAYIASSDGDVIHLQNGYYPISYQIALEKNVTIVSDGERDKTILYRTNNQTVSLVCLYNETCSVQNLTISGLNREGTASISNRGVYLTKGRLINCVISSHSSNADGGGIRVYGTGKGCAIIDRCIITNNSSAAKGGGVHLMNGGTCRNSLIVNNSSQGGSAVFFATSNASLQNCIMANNKSTAEINNAIRFGAKPTSSSIQGCILYNNCGKNNALDENPNGAIYSEITNIVNPPSNVFKDPESGDFHFVRGLAEELGYLDRFVVSDYGSEFPIAPYDLDGNPRIRNNRIDMGCFELRSLPTKIFVR